MNKFPQTLTIAGSDCDGSAGMQADMNTFFSRGVYGLSTITACVAGNSYGIEDSIILPSHFIEKQCEVINEDFEIKAVKTGMLANLITIKTVVNILKKYDFGVLTVDPVIITKHGNSLLEEEAYNELRTNLLPLADIVTPNYYEAMKITEMTFNDDKDILIAARKLQKMGVDNVVIKGRHNCNEKVVRDYVLLSDGQDFWLEHPYIDTEHINGTGDTLSACITAEIAKGKTIKDAICIADEYTYKCIAKQIDIGHKYGPINHWV